MAFMALLSGALDSLLHAQTERQVIPNDPLFRYQVSFLNPGGPVEIPRNSFQTTVEAHVAVAGVDANITPAWAVTTGSRSVVVAILDDGFFYQHEDVRDNLWRNPGETGLDSDGLSRELNGVDDDGNGFVDDVVGWDFAFNDPDPDAYVFDGMRKDRIQPYTHSIDALGIIGAKGNNAIGVAGINWEVSMMLLKIGAQGTPRDEIDLQRKHRAAAAIRYAVDNGARVINWSGFVEDKDLSALGDLRAAFEHAERNGVLIVLGAGNSGLNHDVPHDPVYPQGFRSDNVLLVAQASLEGSLVRSSDFGLRTVHLAAIGHNYTTFVRNGHSAYRLSGGTSNSAPVVTGVAALILAVRPDIAGLELKKILIESATKLPPLEDKVVSGGMVNAGAALMKALSLPSERD